MAIDTRLKRVSVMQMSLSWAMHGLIPDGAIVQVDRQHNSMMYAGIALDGPPDVSAVRRLLGKVFPFKMLAGPLGLFAGRLT